MEETENRIESDLTRSKHEPRHWFAIKIVHRLADLDLTQRDLAEKAGVSINSLQPFLSGRHPSLPKTDLPEKVAEVLGLSFSRTQAPKAMGEYDRSKFSHLLARTYRTFKPLPGNPDVISVFRTKCEWNDSDEFATFKEVGRPGTKEHWGSIANAIHTNVFYFLSFSPRGNGYRQICVNVGHSGRRFGGFLSSTYDNGHTRVPFVSPIYYVDIEEAGAFQDGPLTPKMNGYDDIRSAILAFETNGLGVSTSFESQRIGDFSALTP